MAVHGKEAENMIWGIPEVKPIKGFRWVWWFWLLFVKNPKNPNKPRQLMILWSFKDSTTKIFDTVYEKPDKVEEGEKEDQFPGIVAAWYFDGEKMDHDFALEKAEVKVERIGDGGKVFSDTKNTYEFSGHPGKYKLIIKNDKADMEYELKLDNTKSYYNANYGEQKFLKGMFMYDGIIMNRHALTGRIGDEKVEGTAYFQKIALNNPSLPWFWGVVHFEDGSCLKYFFPHLSTALFRKSSQDMIRGLEKYMIPAKRDIEFYNASEDKLYKFRKMRVDKILNDQGLPAWLLSFHNRRTNQALTARLDCYSRAFWRFESMEAKMPLKVLHYNEYPCKVTEFKFKDKDKEVTLRDLGPGVGNSEHTWGSMF